MRIVWTIIFVAIFCFGGLAFCSSLLRQTPPAQRLATPSPEPLPELKHVTDPNDIIHRLARVEQIELLMKRRTNILSVLTEQFDMAGVKVVKTTSDGDRAYVTLRQTSLLEMAQMKDTLCRGRWRGKYGEVEFDSTLRGMRRAGLGYLRIIAGDRQVAIAISPDGACEK